MKYLPLGASIGFWLLIQLGFASWYRRAHTRNISPFEAKLFIVFNYTTSPNFRDFLLAAFNKSTGFGPRLTTFASPESRKVATLQIILSYPLMILILATTVVAVGGCIR